ncbi:MAG TPA: SDR family oxidoreductase [Ktedonobacteraceae bacterium]|nr:SDR family oxidoreductase [Ktedonobacteraceae bacterium]
MPPLNTSMQGKVCIVTGANSGIGKATALGLAQKGATVIMVCRNQVRGEVALNEIKEKSGNEVIDLMLADLTSQESIRQLAGNILQLYQQVHVLINNAGVVNLTRRETPDGLEMMFAVNYLAPFLLTNLLLEKLKASAPARIVNVSSDSHQAGYIKMDDLQSEESYKFLRSYGQSKLAMVLFTYELARRLQGTGVTANCLHPGFVATNIGQNGVGSVNRSIIKLIFTRVGISPEEGAKTSIYLASSPEIEGITGKYFVKSIPVRSAPISYDETLQRQLWLESAKLVNLHDVDFHVSLSQ